MSQNTHWDNFEKSNKRGRFISSVVGIPFLIGTGLLFAGIYIRSPALINSGYIGMASSVGIASVGVANEFYGWYYLRQSMSGKK